MSVAKFFSSNYTPLYNKKATINYINDFFNQMEQLIAGIYQITVIDQPLLTTKINTLDSPFFKARQINFDNKFNAEVYGFYTNIDNFMHISLLQLAMNVTNTGLICYSSIINRDALMLPYDSVVQKSLRIELNLLEDQYTLNHLRTIINDFWYMICKVSANLARHKYKKLSFHRSKINFITIKQLEDFYPTIPLNGALENYIINNGPTVIFKPYEKLHSNKVFMHGCPSSEDYNLTGYLFVFNPIIQRTIKIMRATIRPEGQVALQQVRESLVNENEINLYDKRIFDPSLKRTLGIEIYFSDLMMFNLKKEHLAEVINSVWTEEFYKYVKDNKIEIF